MKGVHIFLEGEIVHRKERFAPTTIANTHLPGTSTTLQILMGVEDRFCYWFRQKKGPIEFEESIRHSTLKEKVASC